MTKQLTADEAIAIVAARLTIADFDEYYSRAYAAGARHAIEALAAAGVFVPSEGVKCRSCNGTTRTGLTLMSQSCAACGGTGRVHQTMADKLDAAEIR